MNQIKAGAALNVVSIGLNLVLGLLYTPFMLRMLGQSEYGLYSLVASIIAYLTLFDFGFANASIRYTAKYRAEGRFDEMWHLFGMFIIVYCVISLLAVAAGAALYFNVDRMFDRTMTPDELSQARLMLLLLIVNLAVTFPLSTYGAIITAYEDFVFQKSLGILRQLLTTGVIVVMLLWGYKAVAMVVVQTVFNIAVLLANCVFCYRKLHIKVRFGKFDFALVREIALYSLWVFIGAIIYKIYWSTGQFVLGMEIGTVAVAVFSLSVSLVNMYSSFSGAVSSVLFPRITAMVSKKCTDREFSDIFIKAGRMIAIVILPILTGFIVFGKPFIELWAGKDYAESYYVCVILFTVLFIPFVQDMGNKILMARNQMKFTTLIHLTIALVCFVLQFVLARTWGATGCGVSVALSLLLGEGLVMNIYYKRVQRLDIGRFWRQLLSMTVVPALLTVTGIVAVARFGFTSIGPLLLAIVAYSAIFAIFFWKFSLNSYEKSLILKPICRRGC